MAFLRLYTVNQRDYNLIMAFYPLHSLMVRRMLVTTGRVRRGIFSKFVFSEGTEHCSSVSLPLQEQQFFVS